MHPLHRETHLIERIGWLRAAGLGANDGIISTASLVVGVATAATSPGEVLVSGGSIVCLAVLGMTSARAGGDGIAKPALRVTFWGAFAMAASAAIGGLVGHAV